MHQLFSLFIALTMITCTACDHRNAKDTGNMSGVIIPVRIDENKYGFINDQGELLFGNHWHDVNPFNYAINVVYPKEGVLNIIDRNGEIIHHSKSEEGRMIIGKVISDKCVLIKSGSDQYMYDIENGKASLSSSVSRLDIYRYVNSPYTEFTSSDNKAGIIGNDGKIVVEPKYDFAVAGDKYAYLQNNKQSFVCDLSNGNLLNLNIQNIVTAAAPSDGTVLLSLRDNGKRFIRYYDINLKKMISGEFEHGQPFSSGLAPVSEGVLLSRYYIDISGSRVNDVKYQIAERFISGYAVAKKKATDSPNNSDDGEWVILDKNAVEIYRHSDIQKLINLGNGYFWLQSDKLSGVIKSTGGLIWKTETSLEYTLLPL